MHRILMAAGLAMATVASAADDMSNWYPFQSSNEVRESVIGMESWLEKPAGARGPVKMVGDHFELADGTPIR